MSNLSYVLIRRFVLFFIVFCKICCFVLHCSVLYCSLDNLMFFIVTKQIVQLQYLRIGLLSVIGPLVYLMLIVYGFYCILHVKYTAPKLYYMVDYYCTTVCVFYVLYCSVCTALICYTVLHFMVYSTLVYIVTVLQ